MAIEKKLICFARLVEFERQLAAGNILDYSIVFIQDAKKIWSRGTYYDCKENVLSDWAQEDPAADSYIRNRTHYYSVLDFVGQFVTVSKEVGDVLFEGLSEGAFYTIINNQNDSKRYSFQFVTGRKINIPFNGPTVEAVCSEDGSLVLASSTYGIAESFSVQIAEVKQLDDMYIPETIARKEEVVKKEIFNGLNLAHAQAIYDGEFIYALPTTATGEEDDVLVSRGALKTINGESLYGESSEDISLVANEDGFAVANGLIDDDDAHFALPTKSEGFADSHILATRADIGETNNVYVTDFTVYDLEYIHDNQEGAMQFDIRSLYDAFASHKVVLVPYGEGSAGYSVATGYQDDFLYVDIMLQDNRRISLEIPNIDDNAIYPENIYITALAYEGNLKTINGKSIVGIGNIEISGGSGTITEVKANGTSIATSGVANIPAASTSAYGVTKLSSATNSTSTSLAATASAVKAAYDLANSYKGTVTGVKVNGTTKSPSSGTVDVGNVVTSIKINGSTKTPSSGVVDLGTISGGGSGGGSSAYSEVNHGTSDTTFTLTPNTFHIWDEVSSLTLDLGSETSGVANEFLFQFTSGSEATTLSISDDIKWTEELVIEPNRIYQVSILKGLASVLSWDNININIITFTYNGATYETESNMTWQQFIVSDYNVLSWRVAGYEIFTGAGYLSYNGSRVRYDDIIIENGSYYSTQESGGGGN